MSRCEGICTTTLVSLFEEYPCAYKRGLRGAVRSDGIGDIRNAHGQLAGDHSQKCQHSLEGSRRAKKNKSWRAFVAAGPQLQTIVEPYRHYRSPCASATQCLSQPQIRGHTPAGWFGNVLHSAKHQAKKTPPHDFLSSSLFLV